MSNELISYGDYNPADDLQDMRAEDIILPRLTLMQYGSQIVKDRKAQPGDYVNSATGDIMIEGNSAGKVIPIGWWLEWIEWNPKRKESKRILNRSVDPNGDLARMSNQRLKIRNEEGKEVYRVNESYTFTVLMPELFGNYDDMAVFSFQKTGHFVGKQWLNRIRGLRNGAIQVPMPAALWEFSSKQDRNDNGDDYLIPNVGGATLLDMQTAQYCMEKAKLFRERKDAMISVASESSDDEAPRKEGEPPF